MAGGKALQDEINDRMRVVLRELMASKGWDQTQAGEELDVKQQSVSSFLARNTGASLHLAWQIAKAARRTLDELITGKPDGRAPRFEDLPNWRESEPDAHRMFSHVPTAAFATVRNWRAEDPPKINALIIGTLAETWWKSQQIPEAIPPATLRKTG